MSSRYLLDLSCDFDGIIFGFKELVNPLLSKGELISLCLTYKEAILSHNIYFVLPLTYHS